MGSRERGMGRKREGYSYKEWKNGIGRVLVEGS